MFSLSTQFFSDYNLAGLNIESFSSFYVQAENFINNNWKSLLVLFDFVTFSTALLVISMRSPISAVMWLIILFLLIAGFLLTIGYIFLGLSYILVYISAVSILFLFTLMLLNIRISELYTDNNNSLILGLIVTTIFVSSIYFSLNNLTIINFFKNIFNVGFISWDGFLLAFTDIQVIGTKWFRESLQCLLLLNYGNFLKLLMPICVWKITSDCYNITGKAINQKIVETKMKNHVSKTTNLVTYVKNNIIVKDQRINSNSRNSILLRLKYILMVYKSKYQLKLLPNNFNSQKRFFKLLFH